MRGSVSQSNESGLMKVRFSIGAKLIIIITLIVLISLGSIIALASLLIRHDLQLLAEDTNFEANRRAAAAAESVFENMLSNSLILIRTITSAGTDSVLASETTDFFFERNTQAAFIFFNIGDVSENLVNENFFIERNIDISLAESFKETHDLALRRASAGETLLFNAAGHFSAPLLAFFFPWQYGGAGVLFSPMDLNDSFGYGVNQSYLINYSGDVLIHADFDMVRNSVNVAQQSFIKSVYEKPDRSAQTLYTDEDGKQFFGAFSKLNTAGAIVITSIEYNKVFEGIDATTRRNIFLAITVLSISIICIWFFAKSISVPIRVLAAVAHDIEGGKFELDIPPPKTHDEIGVLTSSFQRMCKALNIFGRFTNRDIAVRAMRGEIKPGGFPKNATVFFSDIRGFTAISENFTNVFEENASDRIVHWLNNYFTKMIDCVERTGGVVDKFIGDALMAHWGTAYTTGSTRKDAYNCISAALMMRRALMKMNNERDKDDPNNPRIQFGCGINTGLVTAGQLGSDKRMEYTAIGDPVNLASRVEALNKPFGTDILISENTWKLVRRRFLTEEMPSVTVKGKEKPVRIFAVINYAKNTKGPKTLIRLRRILGIKQPEHLAAEAKTDELKFKITGKKQRETNG